MSCGTKRAGEGRGQKCQYPALDDSHIKQFGESIKLVINATCMDVSTLVVVIFRGGGL